MLRPHLSSDADPLEDFRHVRLVEPLDATDRRKQDRLGRNLKHLVALLEDVLAVGVAFVSLGEGIDCTTAAGRLQLHVLAALAEFARARIADRVGAGLARVRVSGKRLGRPTDANLTCLLMPYAMASPRS